MSAGYRGQCVAEHGPRSIRIYTAENPPRLVATTRAVDHGSVDELLRAYGWHRVEAWQRSDDVPDSHRVATVERINESAIDVLDRDDADGREHSGTSEGCGSTQRPGPVSLALGMRGLDGPG